MGHCMISLRQRVLDEHPVLGADAPRRLYAAGALVLNDDDGCWYWSLLHIPSHVAFEFVRAVVHCRREERRACAGPSQTEVVFLTVGLRLFVAPASEVFALHHDLI